jgi:hypothetical protein
VLQQAKIRLYSGPPERSAGSANVDSRQILQERKAWSGLALGRLILGATRVPLLAISSHMRKSLLLHEPKFKGMTLVMREIFVQGETVHDFR